MCSRLVAAGERQDEDCVGGQRRSEALMMLTEMCPSHALTIRSLCVRTYSDNIMYITSVCVLVVSHCWLSDGKGIQLEEILSHQFRKV